MALQLLKSKQISLEFQADPKRFKKYHKVKYKNSNTDVSALQAGLSLILNRHTIFTPKQLLTILKLVKPELKRFSRTAWILLPIKVDTILTKKPKDIRMGRGKGAPAEKVFLSKSGMPLFTLYGLHSVGAQNFLNTCLHKVNKATQINKNKW